MKKYRGISLILLVITIIVIIILSGTVILSLVNNNLIARSNEAVFKTNINEYNSQLALSISNEYLKDCTFDQSTFNKGIWNGEAVTEETIKKYIPSITVEDGLKFEIQAGKLVYVGSDVTEQDWFTNIGIVTGEVTSPEEAGLGLNEIATDNTTFNGETATYDNPIIPKGFMAINTTTTWPDDWNSGLVIEDESGNQFVWVPVDGTNVLYEKWCTSGVAYNDVNIFDDTVTGIPVESAQITTYGGFYIARYEAMFDYNSGSIRAASKVSTNTSDSTLSWIRDNAHTGYLWNFISYTDANLYSENMAASYGYDPLKVKSGLVTGTQWDTVMKWIQNASISVTDSRAWGNHSNSIAPANVGSGSYQVSGFSENWKAKNIYNLAGNITEWSNEYIGSTGAAVHRGGFSYAYGNTRPAAYRGTGAVHNYEHYTGFRVVLYIL